jgi:hypothetical protein
VIDIDAAFARHVFKIAVADPVFAIPTHCPKDHLAAKMTPFEIAHKTPASNHPRLRLRNHLLFATGPDLEKRQFRFYRIIIHVSLS